jgi:hypothetical protein
MQISAQIVIDSDAVVEVLASVEAAVEARSCSKADTGHSAGRPCAESSAA